jgi:hypothetical protein
MSSNEFSGKAKQVLSPLTLQSIIKSKILFFLFLSPEGDCLALQIQIYLLSAGQQQQHVQVECLPPPFPEEEKSAISRAAIALRAKKVKRNQTGRGEKKEKKNGRRYRKCKSVARHNQKKITN